MNALQHQITARLRKNETEELKITKILENNEISKKESKRIEHNRKTQSESEKAHSEMRFHENWVDLIEQLSSDLKQIKELTNSFVFIDFEQKWTGLTRLRPVSTW